MRPPGRVTGDLLEVLEPGTARTPTRATSSTTSRCAAAAVRVSTTLCARQPRSLRGVQEHRRELGGRRQHERTAVDVVLDGQVVDDRRGLDFTVSSWAMASRTTVGSTESSATDAPRRISMGTMRMPSRRVVARGRHTLESVSNNAVIHVDSLLTRPSFRRGRACVGVDATFTLRDLVERTRVPATTIHHYQRLGLLPPPDRAAWNRFVYDDRHVQALRLIRLLRERRRLGLGDDLADPAAAPRPGRAGVPGVDVGERDRHRRGRHHDRGPGPDRRRRRRPRPMGSRNVSAADICDEGPRHGQGHVLRALRLQGRPVRGRRGAPLSTTSSPLSTPAGPVTHSPPRPSPPSSTTHWVTKPRCSSRPPCAACTASRAGRGAWCAARGDAP